MKCELCFNELSPKRPFYTTSHNFFYPYENKFQFWGKIYFVVCKNGFNFDQSKILSFDRGVTCGLFISVSFSLFPMTASLRELGCLTVIVLTGHVLRRLDLSNITYHRPLVRRNDYALISSAQWRKKNGYYHLHFGLF